MAQDILIRGAREHNLKGVNVRIPRDKLVVITGLSGSGKSSLAFDTLYAEGQRRYVESLSAYARQFLGQMKKPEVEHIEGLSPAISIDQKSVSHNPRSTVGTVTEIYDYLRLLFAHIGVPHCPDCGKAIRRQSAQEIVQQILALPKGAKIQVLAPVVRDQKGEYRKIFGELKARGFARVRVDGTVGAVDDTFDLGRYKRHTIEVVVDRLTVDEGEKERLTEATETALRAGDGLVVVNVAEGKGKSRDETFSEAFACPEHGATLPEMAPRIFSFNSPHGACETCDGLGSRLEIDAQLMIADPARPVGKGLFQRDAARVNMWLFSEFRQIAKDYGLDPKTPWNRMTKAQRELVLYGTKGKGYWDFEGFAGRLERLFKETESEYLKSKVQQYMSDKPCRACRGRRLKASSLSVTIVGRNIIDVTEMPVGHCLDFFEKLETALGARERKIAHEVVKEIRERLAFMKNVGLDYLSLSRASSTLSGGESQRIRLATQIGSGLVGVLYILDEPSIGLHQRDNDRLLESLRRLRDAGNTLIIVEHDEDTMRAADWLIDLGPGAGEHGGRIVAEGTPDEVQRNAASLTGRYLSGQLSIPVPARRRQGNGKSLLVRKATANNLAKIDVEIPLGKLVLVTGVSGSGKSTLVNDVLYRSVANRLHGSREPPGACQGIDGVEHLDKIIIIDQNPIGRTPRSNPATYTGLFTPIRDLFARTPDAARRGYRPGRFSFNVHGGRCEACQGDGIVTIEMHFLPDVYVPCDVCRGARYNTETLAVRYKGKNIRDVLDMSVEEALGFFENIPAIHSKLKTLFDVGLGYVRLGQPATQLSGGEAQRVKLATELSKRATGKTMYVLDEPTTGLHAHDIRHLLSVLGRLVDAGNTALVIEHNLDVVKTGDWIIDLGPEGGDRGGQVVATGTPEQVARSGTHTGQFLRRALAPSAQVEVKAAPIARSA